MGTCNVRNSDIVILLHFVGIIVMLVASPKHHTYRILIEFIESHHMDREI
jgi:hypothetical protein